MGSKLGNECLATSQTSYFIDFIRMQNHPIPIARLMYYRIVDENEEEYIMVCDL